MSEFTDQKIKEIRERIQILEGMQDELEGLKGALAALEGRVKAEPRKTPAKKPAARQQKPRLTRKRKQATRKLTAFDEKVREFLNAHPGKKYTPIELGHAMKLPKSPVKNMGRTVKKLAVRGQAVYEVIDGKTLVSSTKNASKEMMSLSLTTTGVTKDEARAILSGHMTVAGQT